MQIGEFIGLFTDLLRIPVGKKPKKRNIILYTPSKKKKLLFNAFIILILFLPLLAYSALEQILAIFHMVYDGASENRVGYFFSLFARGEKKSLSLFYLAPGGVKAGCSHLL